MSAADDDRWAAGDAYEAYMGRWSRRLARTFVDWLGAAPSAHWLELGCGTGALTAAICAVARPASVVACDPSAPFVEHARHHVEGPCTFAVLMPGAPLPQRIGGFDCAVSGLVLNFVSEPQQVLAALRERVRRGGAVAAYVWDYAGGIEFLRCFWEEAVAADPAAAALDEARRFGHWNAAMIESLFAGAGLTAVLTDALAITTEFANFDDFWRPFLGGTGPAPAYIAGLPPERREQLRERLRRRLAARDAGAIRLSARAFAVRGQVP